MQENGYTIYHQSWEAACERATAAATAAVYLPIEGVAFDQSSPCTHVNNNSLLFFAL